MIRLNTALPLIGQFVRFFLDKKSELRSLQLSVATTDPVNDCGISKFTKFNNLVILERFRKLNPVREATVALIVFLWRADEPGSDRKSSVSTLRRSHEVPQSEKDSGTSHLNLHLMFKVKVCGRCASKDFQTSLSCDHPSAEAIISI